MYTVLMPSAFLGTLKKKGFWCVLEFKVKCELVLGGQKSLMGDC